MRTARVALATGRRWIGLARVDGGDRQRWRRGRAEGGGGMVAKRRRRRHVAM